MNRLPLQSRQSGLSELLESSRVKRKSLRCLKTAKSLTITCPIAQSATPQKEKLFWPLIFNSYEDHVFFLCCQEFRDVKWKEETMFFCFFLLSQLALKKGAAWGGGKSSSKMIVKKYISHEVYRSSDYFQCLCSDSTCVLFFHAVNHVFKSFTPGVQRWQKTQSLPPKMLIV